MKILTFGHWSDTGFGIVTQELTRRWVLWGHDVRIIAVNYRGEPVQDPLMAGRVWPAGIQGDHFGGNISHEAAIGMFWAQYNPDDAWIPDVCFMIGDAGTLMNYIGRPRTKGPTAGELMGPFGKFLPTWNYVPIEGPNLRVSWRDLWKDIQPVAMSEYGQRLISEHLNRAVPMVYHGVDSETFYPIDSARVARLPNNVVINSRRMAKDQFGFDPDRRIILRADRLVERKQYHVLLQAMQPVFEQVLDVDLVIHCKPRDGALDLYEEIARLPENLWPRVKLTNAHDTWRGLPKEVLNVLYNAADLYVSPTGGEGFGLTLAESLAAGTPVITTRFAAGSETAAKGSFLVEPLHDEYGETVLMRSNYGMDWALADPRAFTAAIIHLLNMKPHDRAKLGREGRTHVQQSFSWDTAAAQIIALMEPVWQSDQPSPKSSDTSRSRTASLLTTR